MQQIFDGILNKTCLFEPFTVPFNIFMRVWRAYACIHAYQAVLYAGARTVEGPHTALVKPGRIQGRFFVFFSISFYSTL